MFLVFHFLFSLHIDHQNYTVVAVNQLTVNQVLLTKFILKWTGSLRLKSLFSRPSLINTCFLLQLYGKYWSKCKIYLRQRGSRETWENFLHTNKRWLYSFFCKLQNKFVVNKSWFTVEHDSFYMSTECSIIYTILKRQQTKRSIALINCNVIVKFITF